ncbi:Phosphatidylinositol-4-phosphate 5-kinase [Marasmius crinis-equi]|uniref:Phosphatidylinositol-4-phosphate 5-kinase n=1 Tax=Marasmius crinis-equi TaxID=585013 RepID=A0ABR3FSF6_9AGAR
MTTLSRSPSSGSFQNENQRLSLLSTKSAAPSSSAASYRTAPVSNSSSSSSLSTVNNTVVNPMHALAQQRGEIHILKVTGDTVQVGSGPVPESFIQKMSKHISTAIDPDNHDHGPHGPPPPSPPATEDGTDDLQTVAAEQQDRHMVPDEPNDSTSLPASVLSKHMSSEPPSSPTVIFEEPEPIQRTRTSSFSTQRQVPVRSTTLATDHPRSSIDTKSSLRTVTASESLPHPPPKPPVVQPSQTDYLQPPPTTSIRPARRNTTGSAFNSLPSRSAVTGARTSLLSSQHNQYGSTPGHTNLFPSDDPSDMTNDIQLHAERIRRERQEKRAKAEAALTRQTSAIQHRDEDVPLVGNLIGEDHVNYVLMYNMLTGIRIGVSRCQAKIKRPLTDEDFTARHKYSFDIVGNELTPSAKYDFKFKDYAPWVFRSLREDHFHLDPADYLLSLTSKYILSELGSPGKSGSFFYFSRDYRFIIKTIHHKEHKFLLGVLKKYYEHVKSNPHTLISRFYGLHRVKLPRGRKIHFVIMNNLFPPHKDIHETYDLKGSTVGREWFDKRKEEPPSATESQNSAPSKKKKTSPVMKDLNWIKADKRLELGPEKRALLTEQLRRDKELLKSMHVMDYSLLVGIHNMQRGNRDNVRRKTLKVFDPDIPIIRRHATTSVHNLSKTKSGSYYGQEAMAARRAMRGSEPKPFEGPESNGHAIGAGPPVHIRVDSTGSARALRNSSSSAKAKGKEKAPDEKETVRELANEEAPVGGNVAAVDEKDDSVLGLDAMDAHTGDRANFVFYQDEGGIRATDEGNDNMDTIYYLGVIDILTPYNGLKKIEHFWKGLSADRHKISPVPPAEYAERFFRFMKAIMRGGEGGESFV